MKLNFPDSAETYGNLNFETGFLVWNWTICFPDSNQIDEVYKCPSDFGFYLYLIYDEGISKIEYFIGI